MAAGSQTPAGMRAVHGLFGAWTASVLAFLYLPIVLLVVYSFNDSHLNVRWRGFTWRWYGELWTDTTIRGAAVNSLLIAAAVTAVSVPLGVLGAWVLHRYRFPGVGVMRTLVAVPLIIPDVVMGVSLLVLFAVVCAWGNGFIETRGWGEDVLGLGFATVILAHVTFCFPFVLVAVQARLAGMDPALEEAAMDLGATPVKAFAKVIVPYLMPAIVSGGLMAFTLSMDELIVTYFVSGPGSTTLPIKVFGMAKVGLSPVLNAASAVFVAVTTVLVVAAAWLQKRRLKDEG